MWRLRVRCHLTWRRLRLRWPAMVVAMPRALLSSGSMAAALGPPLSTPRSSRGAVLRNAALALGAGAACGAEAGLAVEGALQRRRPNTLLQVV